MIECSVHSDSAEVNSGGGKYELFQLPFIVCPLTFFGAC